MSNDIRVGAQQLPPAINHQPQPAKVGAGLRAQPAEAAPAVEAPKPDLKESRRILQEAAERLNRQMTRASRDLSFSVDEAADTVVITVKNRESGEVVRQIPNEVALRVARNLDDMKGLLEDKTS